MSRPRDGVFVTGTDTGIGTTFISAALVQRWQADYWKPAQTGLATEPGDSETVATLTGAAPRRIHPPCHAFAAPLSPEAAAAREGASVALADFALPAGDAPIIVEGAGGVLVPLSPAATMVDLMRHLGLPVLLVARGSLGTINHTLLSLEALRARDLRIAGVVISGDDEDGNGAAIARHGHTRILAVVPRTTFAQACALMPGKEAVLP
jgi:malonyl-CoA O-methyltransferase